MTLMSILQLSLRGFELGILKLHYNFLSTISIWSTETPNLFRKIRESVLASSGFSSLLITVVRDRIAVLPSGPTNLIFIIETSPQVY
jgi:hypothetical protein